MFLILLPQGVNTVNHLLDQLNLGVSEPVLVGDVVGVAGLSTRLTTGAAGLQVQLFAARLEGVNAVLGPSGQVNMDRGPHAGTKVGRARVDVSVLCIKAEVLAGLLLDRITNSLDALGKPGENLLDITTLLHGDDAELVLLVDPDEESLFLVVEDTTALRPVALHASNSQVPVSRNEQEVIINKLLPDLLVHASKGVVVTSQVSGEVLDSCFHQVLNTNTLVPGDTGRQTKAINGTANTDPAGVDGSISDNIALDLAGVHVGGVLGRGADSMVLLDEGVENGGKVLVGVPVSGVDATVLVVKLNSAGNGLD